MLLYYIRHGDPIYDPDSLTPLGLRQAEAVGRRLATYGIDEIYASTSQRAIMTATPLSEILNKPITQLDWANEGHAWREFTVKTEGGHKIWMFGDPATMALFNSKEMRDMNEDWVNHPRIEEKTRQGIERINREVDAFMAQFGYVHNRDNASYHVNEPNKKRIALFAHHGFGMAFFSSILDIPYPLYSTHFDITHSGVSVICFPENPGKDVYPRVLTHSNDSHIYKANLPTTYNRTMNI